MGRVPCVAARGAGAAPRRARGAAGGDLERVVKLLRLRGFGKVTGLPRRGRRRQQREWRRGKRERNE